MSFLQPGRAHSARGRTWRGEISRRRRARVHKECARGRRILKNVADRAKVFVPARAARIVETRFRRQSRQRSAQAVVKARAIGRVVDQIEGRETGVGDRKKFVVRRIGHNDRLGRAKTRGGPGFQPRLRGAARAREIPGRRFARDNHYPMSKRHSFSRCRNYFRLRRGRVASARRISAAAARAVLPRTS